MHVYAFLLCKVVPLRMCVRFYLARLSLLACVNFTQFSPQSQLERILHFKIFCLKILWRKRQKNSTYCLKEYTAKFERITGLPQEVSNFSILTQYVIKIIIFFSNALMRLIFKYLNFTHFSLAILEVFRILFAARITINASLTPPNYFGTGEKTASSATDRWSRYSVSCGRQAAALRPPPSPSRRRSLGQRRRRIRLLYGG